VATADAVERDEDPLPTSFSLLADPDRSSTDRTFDLGTKSALRRGRQADASHAPLGHAGPSPRPLSLSAASAALPRMINVTSQGRLVMTLLVGAASAPLYSGVGKMILTLGRRLYTQ
jgi:hypothetical protein